MLLEGIYSVDNACAASLWTWGAIIGFLLFVLLRKGYSATDALVRVLVSAELRLMAAWHHRQR